MNFIGIIPARYASTRFPGKPLALLGGKPVIQHVYERVASELTDVCVATDDSRIVNAVKAFGGNVVMTSDQHRSGTDRCLEAYRNIGSSADVVINIQGDEPFINPMQLRQIKSCFDDADTQIATLIRPYDPNSGIGGLENPNSPKVTVDVNGFALMFSRSVIPHLRGIEKSAWPASHRYFIHIGMYAYRADVLAKITALPQSSLELAESLEQLRWLENGFRIKTGISEYCTIGIDTPADLEAAESLIKQN